MSKTTTKRQSAPKMTEAEVVARIRTRYCTDSGNGPAAVLLPQVRNAAGFDANRTADALVMGLWPSRGLHLEGFEVKCSRADVLKELRDPSKAEAFARYCDRWWLVLADAAHIKDGELPEPWGLLVCRGERLHQVKAAPLRDVPATIPKGLLATMLRQHDRQAAMPAAEALRQRYNDGIEAGKRQAVGEARRGLLALERIEAFEKATGLRVTDDPDDLAIQATAVRLLIGEHGSWGALLPRVRRLVTSATSLAAAAADLAAEFEPADGQ